MSNEDKWGCGILIVIGMVMAMGVGAVLGRVWFGWSVPTQLRHEFLQVSGDLTDMVVEITLERERTGAWPAPKKTTNSSLRYVSSETARDGTRTDFYNARLDGGTTVIIMMSPDGQLSTLVYPE